MSEDSVLEVIDLSGNEPDVLHLPLRELPTIKYQRRKSQATNSMPLWKICGADTETIEGRIWLFSTELGVWEIDTFDDLLKVLYSRPHARKWKTSKKKKQKNCRGISTHEFFFWNLKFDVQAVLRLFDDWPNGDEIVDALIDGNRITIGTDAGIEIELTYLEGKHFCFKPLNWKIGQYKVGPCYWWDMAQFYGRQRLHAASISKGLEGKIEHCFDGSILDAGRFDDAEYRDYYREDIDTYAVQDAVLAGALSRIRHWEFTTNDIRFIRPYSIANVAQRNLLDTCTIPTVNSYRKRKVLRTVLQSALSSYQGGWFETTGCGFLPDVAAVDLASAYPYVMSHLPDSTAGYWVRGDDADSWWSWIDERTPYSLGFAEAFVVFDAGLKWHPLVKVSGSGTLVAPRIIRGWFSADELAEARQWPHSQFIIGSWLRYVEDDSSVRPFKPFINHHYQMKMDSEKGSIPYANSKTMLNSVYGKTIQAVDDKAGSLWNPMYASTICGGTRARLAELLRVNDYSAVSVATDGVIFRSDDLKIIPPRPLPAVHNLGEWEPDGDGELLVAMSGVYSMKKGERVSTTFRGSASLFLRDYCHHPTCTCGNCPSGLFDFCSENSHLRSVKAEFQRPYSAREARVRSDFSLMNRFVPRTATLKALGDSTKRLWPNRSPSTFNDLRTEWWPSTPHRELEGASVLASVHDRDSME